MSENIENIKTSWQPPNYPKLYYIYGILKILSIIRKTSAFYFLCDAFNKAFFAKIFYKNSGNFRQVQKNKNISISPSIESQY